MGPIVLGFTAVVALENDGIEVSLPGISVPTPAGGKGVFQAGSSGWNNSNKYFQVSN